VSTSDDELDELVQRADLDALVRFIDSVAAARDWPRLMRTRNRCRAAVATGRQLWPAATLAEYRLVLWGDDAHCAAVLDDDTSGRFTIGPLTEVAAQHHAVAGLSAAGLAGPRLGYVAHERALRGDDIDPATFEPFEMPFARQSWEPEYLVATYTDDGVDAPAPPLPTGSAVITDLSGHGATLTLLDDEVEQAVRGLLAPWTQSSDGRVEVVCVDGPPEAALAALGVARARLVPMSPQEALQWLVWCGASGGAHGRRQGTAVGRFGAWWLLAAFGQLTDDWPVHPDELGEVAEELGWWWWDANEPQLGWQLRLVVSDPVASTSWAIVAQDAG
jgi:hypothetical protein